MRRPAAVNAMPRLADLIDQFRRAEVVVAGDFVADEYVYGETERISREAPVLIVRYERSELKAGGAGNAAQNLAALGVKVRAVGVVGDDALGSTLLDVLAACGIDIEHIQRVRGRATESKTRILAGGRSTRRQQMLRVDRAPAQALPPAAQDRVVRDLLRAARGSGPCSLATTAPALSARERSRPCAISSAAGSRCASIRGTGSSSTQASRW